MTEFKKGFLALVRGAFTKTQEQLPDDFDWDKTCQLGKDHQILPILYYGALNLKVDLPDRIKGLLENATMQNFFVDQNQLHQIDLISKAFEENQIDYMLLKGSVLKHSYPKTELRPMSDADILIKTEQYEKVREVMNKIGFKEQYESDHELVWKKDNILMVELHKRIVPSYNKDYYAYFGDGWPLARRKAPEAFGHIMSPEDELIYNFTHMAKHYRDGGIGIRHMLDVYICYCNNGGLNAGYIEEELKKLQLWEFFCNTINTVKVWFENAEATEITDFITEYIFSSGSYGTRESKKLSAEASLEASLKEGKSVKKAKLIKIIFWPYSEMSYKYPVLKKAPFLLPIFWVVRLVDGVFFKKGTVTKRIKGIQSTNEQNIKEFRDDLRFVGLEFNFKEED